MESPMWYAEYEMYVLIINRPISALLWQKEATLENDISISKMCLLCALTSVQYHYAST